MQQQESRVVTVQQFGAADGVFLASLEQVPVPVLEIGPDATREKVTVQPNEALCRALGLSGNADFDAMLPVWAAPITAANGPIALATSLEP